MSRLSSVIRYNCSKRHSLLKTGCAPRRAFAYRHVADLCSGASSIALAGFVLGLLATSKLDTRFLQFLIDLRSWYSPGHFTSIPCPSAQPIDDGSQNDCIVRCQAFVVSGIPRFCRTQLINFAITDAHLLPR